MTSQINWRSLKPGLNLQASSLVAAHYFTDRPEHGWVLYSRGPGGCWNQRTEQEFAPFPGAKPVCINGNWYWK